MSKILVFLSLILVFESGFAQSNKKVLVELFTSQGCSSCPSADKLLKEIVELGDDKVVVLSYHVDYWNRLGWKDPFSITESTQRQYAYAQIFRNSTVYTPQAVVNGEVEFVGSNSDKMNISISNAKKSSRLETLKIDAKRDGIEVLVSIDIQNDAETTILLVQREATTQVNRGENGGRTLNHVNVVRSVNEIENKNSDSIKIQIPSDVKGDLAIVAFQENNSGKLLSLGEVDL